MIDERIARLRELDGKRTPGEWIAGVHPGNHRIHIIKPICFGKYVGKLPECEGGAVYFLNEGTAQFIAAAPEMMKIINELQAKLKTAEGALESMISYAKRTAEYHKDADLVSITLPCVDLDAIKQALAELRK